MSIPLDKNLQNDCHHLGSLNNSRLLLHKNALFNWFILVPDTEETEFYKLAPELQSELLKQINLLSGFIEINWQTDKLNVATIGNIVSQLHIHVIGRRRNDAAWPGVVWGFAKSTAYSADELDSIRNKLLDHFPDSFIPV